GELFAMVTVALAETGNLTCGNRHRVRRAADYRAARGFSVPFRLRPADYQALRAGRSEPGFRAGAVDDARRESVWRVSGPGGIRSGNIFDRQEISEEYPERFTMVVRADKSRESFRAVLHLLAQRVTRRNCVRRGDRLVLRQE